MNAMLLVAFLGALTIEPSRPVEGDLIVVTVDSMAPCVVIHADTYKPASMYRVNDKVLLFTGLRGEYLVQTKEGGKHVAKPVTITPEAGPGPLPPGPDPPGPDPPGPNPPTPPVPDDTVVNTYGFGQLAYAEAVKVRDTNGAKALAKAWKAGAEKLFNGEFTGTADEQIQAAIDYIRAESSKTVARDKWLPWSTTMANLFDSKVADGSFQPDSLSYIRAFREVGNALGKVK